MQRRVCPLSEATVHTSSFLEITLPASLISKTWTLGNHERIDRPISKWSNPRWTKKKNEQEINLYVQQLIIFERADEIFKSRRDEEDYVHARYDSRASSTS